MGVCPGRSSRVRSRRTRRPCEHAFASQLIQQRRGTHRDEPDHRRSSVRNHDLLATTGSLYPVRKLGF